MTGGVPAPPEAKRLSLRKNEAQESLNRDNTDANFASVPLADEIQSQRES
jgi:hypothetical protein